MPFTRAGARSAIATWFAPPNVTGLNTVYTSMPLRIADGDYFTGTFQVQSGAVGIVHIISSRETRIAMGGAHSGIKRVDYDCELQLILHSSKQVFEQANDDFETIIDNAVTRLRADRTLGDASTWQAGEREIEVTDVGFQVTGRWMELWSGLRFDLTQMLMNT